MKMRIIISHNDTFFSSSLLLIFTSPSVCLAKLKPHNLEEFEGCVNNWRLDTLLVHAPSHQQHHRVGVGKGGKLNTLPRIHFISKFFAINIESCQIKTLSAIDKRTDTAGKWWWWRWIAGSHVEWLRPRDSDPIVFFLGCALSLYLCACRWLITMMIICIQIVQLNRKTATKSVPGILWQGEIEPRPESGGGTKYPLNEWCEKLVYLDWCTFCQVNLIQTALQRYISFRSSFLFRVRRVRKGEDCRL